ncbi:MAG: methylated-DNA--[protein]-cysteine S-methyltransferase, partial [Clostridia bacterium]|nr:methylated-DNA--[protein]-cysteine S-methyltransferase [Clostridia bacterium]
AAVGRPQAFRAVGGAEAKNLTSIIISCHRVVAARGGLGGYRLGLEMKARLLRLEGSRVW